MQFSIRKISFGKFGEFLIENCILFYFYLFYKFEVEICEIKIFAKQTKKCIKIQKINLTNINQTLNKKHMFPILLTNFLDGKWFFSK